MPTFDLYLPPKTYSAWHPKQRKGPIQPFAGVFLLTARWIARVRQRNALAALDDRHLRDIGITRFDARHECGKPFWR